MLHHVPTKKSCPIVPTRVALVTGSSSGIGANIAVDLARAGYQVIVTGRDLDKLEKTKELCDKASSIGHHSNNETTSKELQTSCVLFVADLDDFKQIDRLIDFIRTEFNRLDLLINNACWRGGVNSILDSEAFDEMVKVMHINVIVPTYLIHKCLVPLKPENDLGVVLNISSIASQTVVPLHLYSISKACLSEMSRQLAATVRTSKIMSTTISPGPILTDERPHHASMSSLTLLGRVGSPQEISDLVIHILKNILIFNGRELNIDGGYLARCLSASPKG